MKKKTLPFCLLLFLLGAGCVSQGYGPASPDFYSDGSFSGGPVLAPPNGPTVRASMLENIDKELAHESDGQWTQ